MVAEKIARDEAAPRLLSRPACARRRFPAGARPGRGGPRGTADGRRRAARERARPARTTTRATLLAIARTLGLARHRPARTVRFVTFVNEEPPYFWRRDGQPGLREGVQGARRRRGGDAEPRDARLLSGCAGVVKVPAGRALVLSRPRRLRGVRGEPRLARSRARRHPDVPRGGRVPVGGGGAAGVRYGGRVERPVVVLAGRVSG